METMFLLTAMALALQGEHLLAYVFAEVFGVTKFGKTLKKNLHYNLLYWM
jgi:hypothetical protein